MTEMAIRPSITAASTGVTVLFFSAHGTTRGRVEMIPRGQEYFWSTSWQEYERLASEEIATGDVFTFDDPRDALHWLMQNDDD